MPAGLSAQLKLAALPVHSALLGIYLALVLAMIYLLSHRSGSTPERRRADRLLITGIVVLSIAAIGQWACVLIRAFKAFILWEDGRHASWFYYSDTGPSEVTRSAFHSATILIADLFVISRLWVISDHRRGVIALPMLSAAGLLVSGAGTTYAYAKYDALIPKTLRHLHMWKMAHTILTISINVYCTAMIVWYILRVYARSPNTNVGSKIKSVMLLMAESAFVYTSFALAWQVAYGMNHVSAYFIEDCIPPVAALAAVLVHVRAVLGIGREDRSTSVEGKIHHTT